MFIELHMLQNFSPSNLNRDDTNNPKDCIFGGVRRARISSQCIKKSIREHPYFSKTTQVNLAFRSRYIARKIMNTLEEKKLSNENLDSVVKVFVAEMLGGIDIQKQNWQEDPQSKVLYFFSDEEIFKISQIISDNLDEMGKIVSGLRIESHITKKFSEQKDRKLKKYISMVLPKKGDLSRTSCPDIAMYGRMLANEPSLSMDAACQVAHAISTHQVNMEFDFFTAVDDLQEREETGAGMMGIIGYNAATYYRYARIDFDQLLKNLGNDASLARKSVEGFLRAAAHAVPSGKQNSFAAQNPPSFLMAVTRDDGMSWSLANAFEKPVYAKRDQSLLETSIAVLDQYWAGLVEFFGDDPRPVVGCVGMSPELENLDPYLVKDFETWISQSLEALPKE